MIQGAIPRISLPLHFRNSLSGGGRL